MRIIADKREKNSLVISELVSLGVSVEFNHLEVGDFVISDDIALERKTVNDFISSMLSKRLLKQLSNLKSNYRKPLLIIEGIDEQDLYENNFKIHENSVRGMILSSILDFGVSVIFTKDYNDTAKFLYLLARKQEIPSRETSLKMKRKAANLAEQQQFFVEGFPGIGPSLSKNLLKEFKTIKKIINAEPEELEKIKKLDKNKRENIKRIIETDYKSS